MTRVTTLVAAALAAMLVFGIGCQSKARHQKVVVYCAAGLRDPVTDLSRLFEKEFAPATVENSYGSSGELLGRIKTAGAPEYRPDVFIAAEESYADQARQLGLIDNVGTLAYFVPVIAVQKTNPMGIHSLADLARPNVKTVLGDPRGPAIGLITDRILEKNGLMAIRKNAGTFATVQAVAAQVAMRNADATIIWDTVARQGDFQDTLDVIPIPDAPVVRVVICRVNQCANPKGADDLIHFLTATPASKESFSKYGFRVEAPNTSSTQTMQRSE